MSYIKCILAVLAVVISTTSLSQHRINCSSNNNKPQLIGESKKFSFSSTAGYITIPQPNLGNNLWCSANLGYSKKNWNVTVWAGTNYWIEGRQPDLRLGISTSYTWIKW